MPTPECPISVGRTVLYRITETKVRPAIVVRLWDNEMVNLQVFLDGTNDTDLRLHPGPSDQTFTAKECLCGVAWRTSVPKGANIGEWSWPPRVQQKVVAQPRWTYSQDTENSFLLMFDGKVVYSICVDPERPAGANATDEDTECVAVMVASLNAGRP